MEYLEKMLGVSVKYHRWKGELELPYYITERYEMRLVELDKMKCIFLWPKDKLSQIGSLKKQLRRIQMEEALPVVFIMDMIDAYRRTAFIKAHISFIVPDSQIYLPFMGTCLEEKYRMEIQSTETLQPSTQLLLFYWYYAKENCIYMHGAVKALGCSAMTITRAFRQLEKTGCFETGKTGVQKYLKGKSSPDEILYKLEPYLISPLADIIYLDKDVIKGGIIADTEEGKGYPSYAVNKKDFHYTGGHELLNAETQSEIQLWKYDPAILAANGHVDPLSLALSLKKPLFSFIKND